MDFIISGISKAFELLFSGDAETWSAVAATVRAAIYSMSVSLALGIPLGFVLGFFQFRWKHFFRVLVDTMLALPTVFIGLVTYALLSHRGILGEWGLLYTIEGIAIGQTVLALPIIVALTATTVEDLDRSLRLTLVSLGASKIQLFLSMVYEARFGILVAAIAAAGRVLTEVGISIMVGGNIKWHTRTITTAIALETNKGQFSMGIALGIVLLLIAFSMNLSRFFLRAGRRL